MRLSPLVVLLLAVTGCGTATAPGRNSTELPPGTCTVTPVSDVTEFFEMVGINNGCGFRYSGAPIALSLDIYIQTIPEADWKDPEKQKEIFRSKPDKKDQVVAWRSASDDMIKAYEAGKMTDETASRIPSAQEETIVFSFPDNWFSDVRGGYAKLLGHATVDGETLRVSKNVRFPLTKKFRDVDTMGIVGRVGGTPRFPKEPITISPGATTSLIAVSETVDFGDGVGPFYRLVYRLTARCLRPPNASQDAAEH